MKKLLFIYIVLIGLFTSLEAQTQCVGASGQVKWKYYSGFPWTPDSLDLSALENYPNWPNGTQIMGSLQSPINYADNFAGVMKGFINIPVVAGQAATQNYQFAITGDDYSAFYMSPNENPAQKLRRSYVEGWADIAQIYKYPAQRSSPISLTAGMNYYFEMFNYEGGGGDHMTVYWRKTGVTDTTWKIVDFNYIKEYTCESTCAPRGTACNDNNPATTNDLQDGYCNCVGTQPSINACVGLKGKVDAYYYDAISGDYIEPDLVLSPRFPLQPHRKEKLKGAFGPLQYNTNDQYGSMVQGYITVPVSGQYSFNITGDNQTYFFMSKNDSIQYKQTYQAASFWGVDYTEHDKFGLQTVGPIFLEKNKYYYYEIRHKESSWRDHFTLYWKTPFYGTNAWKKVPDFYLFDYNCEVSCVPAGTLCNDSNPNTNNDVFDGNCNCVGTPCVGAACNDEAARYVAYEACNCTDNLLSGTDFSWESCNTAANPNASRASLTRWIRYDFGEPYLVNTSRIWNFNVTGDTDKGFKDVVIDYSLDGVTWTALPGNYVWPQASGANDYSGFIGPDFSGRKIRYLLISASSNYGDATCYGFSKIKFDTKLCNPENTLCDDDDALTMHDRFDNSCNCAGVKIACAQQIMALGKVSLLDTTYKAVQEINATSTIEANQHLSFTAGNAIVFLPGFEVKTNAVFKAEIKNCLQVAFTQNIEDIKENTTDTLKLAKIAEEEDPNVKRIIFKLEKPSQVKLEILDANNNQVVEILNTRLEASGTITKLIPVRLFKKGVYTVKLAIDNTVSEEVFTVE